MGTYTNIFFETENFSINTKSLYPQNVIDKYKEFNKIFFTKGEKQYNQGDNAYLVFGEQEYDGYKHNLNFENTSYNFWYNSDKNTLKIGYNNDFYLYLYDISNFDGDIDTIISKLHDVIQTKYFNYKGLLIADISKFDNRIAFTQDNMMYRVWFKANEIRRIIVHNEEQHFNSDIELMYYFDKYEDIHRIYKETASLNMIDRLRYILKIKEIKEIKHIINIYDEKIKHNIDILREFLFIYNDQEREIINYE
jgi:hypothetical protein